MDLASNVIATHRRKFARAFNRAGRRFSEVTSLVVGSGFLRFCFGGQEAIARGSVTIKFDDPQTARRVWEETVVPGLSTKKTERALDLSA